MTGSSEILVTYGALEEAAADIDRVADQIHQQLTDLRAYVAPLTATWEGVDAAAWGARQQRWDTSSVDLNVILKQIATWLRTQGQNYWHAEHTNARMF
ncbi:MAG TPA: WXG100 family type VII secretion target [Candidatus Dormibacteraeota bacterium]|jgi:WXG100 family type VII secretion target|nr:WXG100 family type VII secretion target [Candidatus Dormibacteraeota bacterium]